MLHDDQKLKMKKKNQHTRKEIKNIFELIMCMKIYVMSKKILHNMLFHSLLFPSSYYYFSTSSDDVDTWFSDWCSCGILQKGI